MSESVRNPKQVRTLTVKNFSVVKEAKLEFKKITVLIGPQSSGKSLLCKLSFFLSNELIEIAATSIASSRTWDQFIASVSSEFQNRFYSTEQIAENDTELAFSSGAYEVNLSWPYGPLSPEFTFSEAFKRVYETELEKRSAVSRSVSGLLLLGTASSGPRLHEALLEFNSVIWGSTPLMSFYAPASRAFFSNISKQTEVLKNVGLDWITRDFAGQLVWDANWKAGLLTSGRGITDEISRQMIDILGGFVITSPGPPRFLTKNGAVFPLEMTSSGTQELIPLFNLIERLIYIREHLVEGNRSNQELPGGQKIPISTPLIYLEEPEANIFPSTQYSLVQLFCWLSSDSMLDFRWVITTHSPYILSVFGDFVKAGKVGGHRIEHHEAVAKVVPEKYWIRDGDFAAYKIESGKLESIFDEKTGQIDGDYLDDVSGRISEELGQLLEIQYGK